MSLACEALATKAELEELKIQLNSLLGKASSGSPVDVLEQGDFTGTVIKEKFDLVDTSMQDIELHNSSGNPIEIIDDLALIGFVEGSNNFVKKQGNSVFKKLPFVNKQTGKVIEFLLNNKEVGKVTKKAAKVSGNSMSILVSLFSIVTSLALNIKTVNVLSFRIDQIEKGMQLYNQDYNSLIRLHQLSNNNVDKMNTELNKAKNVISKQQKEINSLKDDLANSQNQVANLTNLINEANIQIANLQQENLALQQQLSEFEGEVTQDIEDLTNLTSELETRLTQSQTDFDSLLDTTQKIGKQLADLQGKATEQADMIQQLSIQNSKLNAEINLLKKEFAEEKDLTNTKLTLIESKLILAEHNLANGTSGGGGFPATAQKNQADTQTATLQLMNQLAGNPLSSTSTIIEPSELGINNPFTDIFNQLFPQIDITNPEVTPLQLNEITTAIQETVQTTMNDIGLNNVPGDITTIKNNTTPEKIKETVDDSICKKAQPDKCIDKAIKDNNDSQTQEITNNIELKLQGIVFPDFSDCQESLECLQELKEFLEKAWKSTTEDKKINAFNNTLLLHNAMLLSQDVTKTIPKVQGISLQNITPTDYLEQPLELSTKITEILQPFPSSITQLDEPLSLQSTLVKHNQVIQSSYGTIFAVENNKTSTLQGIKLLGKYTSTLGNLMQQQGLLESNSFPWMWENFNLETALNGFVGNYFISQSTIDNVFDLGIQGMKIITDANQSISENQEFIAVDAQLEQLKADYSIQKQQLEDEENLASLSPEIDRLDLIKLEPEEY
ncbi:hypothetical protein Xen7305DRAFT_00045490 [Xenococcus sp. PCC 7305]|uniref:coiled-coil domain-containing protein n=1 Tax=Xenococcus sp. PCC 7305 TaxID=102125 RepID=UPI0002ABC25B|nr:hypothetical protein [Xenococcus sp. PCC 7305]ELS04813.1 hypothetical protein Xen7305DRAFT_00045490 [Xenococcus sp. PCC 7305]